MKEITVVPFSFQSHEVRTLSVDGETWFVARDVCDILELNNLTEALRGLDADELASEFMNSGVQRREMKIISESGLYTLVIRSSKPQAKAFRKWATEVLFPAARELCKQKEISTVNSGMDTDKAVVPFNFEGREVRTIMRAGEPWFVAKDVCDVLGLDNITKALLKIPEGHKGMNPIQTLGGTQKMNVVDESGLYRLILRSDKPQAEPFMEWITSEVLPTIRKTGSYQMGQPAAAQKAPQNAASVKSMVPASKELRAALNIAKMAGLRGNQAVLAADKAVVRLLGESPLAMIGQQHLISEVQEVLLTPTEIGQRLGLTARNVNVDLEQAGLQVPERSPKGKLSWRATEKGMKYAVLTDASKAQGGAPVQQLKWRESVIKLIE